jgi:hypothetical protein
MYPDLAVNEHNLTSDIGWSSQALCKTVKQNVPKIASTLSINLCVDLKQIKTKQVKRLHRKMTPMEDDIHER